jgi:hypothetical protein
VAARTNKKNRRGGPVRLLAEMNIVSTNKILIVATLRYIKIHSHCANEDFLAIS